MYDIYFDEGDMHQTVQEKDEYWYYEASMSSDDDDDYPVIVERPARGLTCTKCGELFPHAEANQKDGTLICYSCRNYG